MRSKIKTTDYRDFETIAGMIEASNTFFVELFSIGGQDEQKTKLSLRVTIANENFMAIKDFTISEDTEHQKPSEESNAASVKPIEKGESAQIKNAHAVGDGSYGRNDENGVEDKGKVEKEDNNY